MDWGGRTLSYLACAAALLAAAGLAPQRVGIPQVPGAFRPFPFPHFRRGESCDKMLQAIFPPRVSLPRTSRGRLSEEPPGSPYFEELHPLKTLMVCCLMDAHFQPIHVAHSLKRHVWRLLEIGAGEILRSTTGPAHRRPRAVWPRPRSTARTSVKRKGCAVGSQKPKAQNVKVAGLRFQNNGLSEPLNAFQSSKLRSLGP